MPNSATDTVTKNSGIILGVDPGTLVMGFALLEFEGSALKCLDMDVLKMSSKKDHYDRLQSVYSCIISLIQKHKPTIFAIEAPFYGKNVQSMLKLGRAQGVAIAAAMHHGLEVTEYSPKKVKQSITGNGNADKQQVWKMLQAVLKLEDKPDYYDASDALSVALCHHYQMNSPLQKKMGKKAGGWESFLKDNPGRVKKI
jgi:crossover junction endodeoxyribonuclease RuvC